VDAPENGDPGRTTPSGGRVARGVAGAAVLIGTVTIAARAVGFGKTLVFARTVESGCLSTAYYTANQIPTILFEIVAGGALASMVVPVLAGPARRAASEAGARADVSRIASALLTWTIVGLVPVSVIIAVLARPLMSVMVGAPPNCDTAQVVAVSTRMLVVFSPQVVLYGVAVVLYGVLQAHRRFLGPALAPLVSSVVVIVAYLMFVPLADGHRDDLARLPSGAELALSVGTTLGVVALVVTVLGPMARLRTGLRPTLRFPPGVAVRVRRLAVAGLATLLAQQAAMLVVIRLANGGGGGGALAVYNYAWALYQVPYAVLAVPIATSAFPVLSARMSDGDTRGFDAMAAGTTRAVVLVSCAAAGVLAAVAVPVARVFLLGTHSTIAPAELADAIVAFAPGLVGYGLIAHAGRALYACGRGRAAASATVAGWLVVMAAQAAFTLGAPRGLVVPALGLGSTAGMTVAGVLLLVALGRVRGRAVLSGLGRTLGGGLLGGAAGYAAGAWTVSAVGPGGPAASVGVTALAAVVAGVVFAAVVAAVARRDLMAALSRTPLRRLPGVRGERTGERTDGQ
jgi:putative peptidoglycan lipid II flippase